MTHNYDSLYSVYSSNKVKEDNFLGQCELPLVPGLPEFTPNESSPQTGQKDCILRYDSSIMTMTHDDSFLGLEQQRIVSVVTLKSDFDIFPIRHFHQMIPEP